MGTRNASPARIVRTAAQSVELSEHVRKSTTAAAMEGAWRAGPPDATVALACADALSRTRRVELVWSLASGGAFLLAEHVRVGLQILAARPERHTQLDLPDWAFRPVLRAPVSCRGVLEDLVKAGWTVPMHLPGQCLELRLRVLRRQAFGRAGLVGTTRRTRGEVVGSDVEGVIGALLQCDDLQPEVLAFIAQWLDRTEREDHRPEVCAAAVAAAHAVAAYQPATLSPEPGSPAERDAVLAETAAEQVRRAQLLRAGTSEDPQELERLFALTEPFTVSPNAPHMLIAGQRSSVSVLDPEQPAGLGEEMSGVVVARSLLRNPALPAALRDALLGHPLARLLRLDLRELLERNPDDLDLAARVLTGDNELAKELIAVRGFAWSSEPAALARRWLSSLTAEKTPAISLAWQLFALSRDSPPVELLWDLPFTALSDVARLRSEESRDRGRLLARDSLTKARATAVTHGVGHIYDPLSLNFSGSIRELLHAAGAWDTSSSGPGPPLTASPHCAVD